MLPSRIDAPDLGVIEDQGLPTVGDLLDRLRTGGDPLAPEGLGGAPGAAAAPAEAVDEPVAVLHQPVPRYPRPLAEAGVGGRVELEYVVDTLGRVEPGSVRELGSPHPELTEAARQSVLRSRFRPARLRGAAVRQLVRQTLVFRLSGGGRP